MEGSKVFKELKVARKLQISLDEFRINKECQRALVRVANTNSLEILKDSI